MTDAKAGYAEAIPGAGATTVSPKGSGSTEEAIVTQQKSAGATSYAEIGARKIPEFDGVHDVWPRGDRLRAVRAAATAYKAFKQQGQVRTVQSSKGVTGERHAR